MLAELGTVATTEPCICMSAYYVWQGVIFTVCLTVCAQTVGLKDGNTVVLCTCAAVSSMVTGLQPYPPIDLLHAPLMFPAFVRHFSTSSRLLSIRPRRLLWCWKRDLSTLCR